MELFMIILLVAILGETSVLTYSQMKSGRKNSGRRKIYVDTSALMDGRILEVARTGFISDDLIIPRSAIREMQLLADGKDSEKRARARAGMELVNELERVEFFNTEILQDALDRTPVDERLIALAKENRGAILTCDYNLEKVAATEHIDVLNVNNLALAMRNEFLPGDKMVIKIVDAGQNRNQGVGYLENGTMVVVDNAAKMIGKETEVQFVRFLQTAAGRMVFAKPINLQSQKHSRRTHRK